MRKLLSVAFALFITSTVIAQSPEKMPYQAVLGDGNGALAINKNVELTISILVMPASWYFMPITN